MRILAEYSDVHNRIQSCSNLVSKWQTTSLILLVDDGILSACRSSMTWVCRKPHDTIILYLLRLATSERRFNPSLELGAIQQCSNACSVLTYVNYGDLWHRLYGIYIMTKILSYYPRTWFGDQSEEFCAVRKSRSPSKHLPGDWTLRGGNRRDSDKIWFV